MCNCKTKTKIINSIDNDWVDATYIEECEITEKFICNKCLNNV